MTTGPTQNYADPDLATQRARPVLALAVRAAVAVLPLVLALVVGAVAALALPPGRVGLPVWLWLVGVVLATSGVLFVCSRLLRRLAPLSALLRISLVLPDDVPYRFALARRRWSPTALESSTSTEDGGPSQRLLELVATLAAHDGRTRAHAERVQAYAALIGRELGLSDRDVGHLSWAALLHDVGKVHVAPEIINKAGKPSEEEWAQLQAHPHHGGELVEPLRGWLGDWLDGVEQHHERFDGTGYPRRLAGQDISLAARIIAVADTYDVITSARSYKKPMSAEQARAEIIRCAGAQFDPVVVRALLSVGIAELRRVAGPATLLALLPVAIAAPAQAAPSVGAVLQAAGSQAATAVLAAGVGVTGGVATADVLAAPAAARVLVVQETSAPSAVTAGSNGPPRGAASGTNQSRGQGASDPAQDGQARLEGAMPAGATPTETAVAPEPGASTPAPGATGDAATGGASPEPQAQQTAAPVATPSSGDSSERRASAPAPAAAPQKTSSASPSAAPPTPPARSAPAAPGPSAPTTTSRPTASSGTAAADDAARAAQKTADAAAARAAKDAADAAKAAQDAAARAAKEAADAAKRASDAAGKLTGGLTSGLTGGLTGGRTSTSSVGSSGSPVATPAPSTSSPSSGGLIGGLLGGGR